MAKTNRILTLDIGASKLVLAEFGMSKTGAPELLNYSIGPLEMGQESEADASAYIVSTLRDMMRGSGIKPAPLLMSVSGQTVFPRYVKLPPVPREKVHQMVRYEAEQNVPFPIDEVVWDYQVMDGEAGGDMNVMLVAAKSEAIAKFTDCVVAAGLEPEVVDVATMALYNIVRYNYPDLQGCTMILDVGARSSNLIFVEANRIFSRSIPVAGNTITQELMKEFELSFKDAEEMKKVHAFVAFGGVTAGPEGETADRVSKVVRNVVTRLHAEVNRSINFYRSQQGGNPPSLVLLSGGSSIIRHADTFFKEKLKVQVEYLNPFVNVAVGAGIDTERIANDLHLLGEVAGLALRRSLKCPLEINLMPSHLVDKKNLRKKQPFFAMAAVGLIFTLLCWSIVTMRMGSMFEAVYTSTNQLVQACDGFSTELASVTAERNEVLKRANHLADLVSSRSQWLQIIDSARACMLDGMWIVSIKPQVDERGVMRAVEITGSGFNDKKAAADVDETEVVRTKLASSGVFTAAEISALTPGTAYNTFTVVATLKNPIKAGNLE